MKLLTSEGRNKRLSVVVVVDLSYLDTCRQGAFAVCACQLPVLSNSSAKCLPIRPLACDGYGYELA